MLGAADDLIFKLGAKNHKVRAVAADLEDQVAVS